MACSIRSRQRRHELPAEVFPGDGDCNGDSESEVRKEKIVRGIESDLEQKTQRDIDKRLLMRAWRQTCEADVPSKDRLGEDGRTALKARAGEGQRFSSAC